MSFVKALFGLQAPKILDEPPPPPPRRETDPEIENRRRQARLALRRRRGRIATILTGGQGVLGPAPVRRPILTGRPSDTLG